MIKTVSEKMCAISERILREAAQRDRFDHFKKLILFCVAVYKYVRGLKREASGYFNYIGFSALAGSGFAISCEDESYYEILEGDDYSVYINSSKELVLFSAPGTEDGLCDIGCGRGFLVRELRRSGYCAAIGIENSKWAAEHKVTPEVYLKKPGDFVDAQFRTVSLISVLEHPKKDEIRGFISEVTRISSDFVVCCIPLYPNNLLNFFVNGADHIIFERREWWDAQFEKSGFSACYLPSGPTPFILPFVYRRKKTDLRSIWSMQRRNLVRMRMGVGDQLCALPAIEEVKRRLPGLSIAVSDDSHHREIFLNNPAIAEVGVPARPGDNIVEFHYQTGFGRHMTEDFAAQAGLDRLVFPVPKVYLAEREKYPLKRGSGPCVAIDTRANWVSRKWEHSRFEETARILKREYGATIIEVGRNQAYDTSAPEPEFLEAADVSYADKLSLRQTASVLAQCDCFLGSDSGLAHLAAAVGTKAFTLFGPVEARFREHAGFTVPIFDTECYGCYSGGLVKSLYEIARRCPRGHHKCMRKITPRRVAAEIAEGLGLAKGGAK